MASTSAPALSDDRLEELMSLLKGADSVELKLTVPESAQRSAVTSLGLDPLDAQIRQVFFFDTPDLALNAHGVVVRARRSQRKGDDSVVKLRPVLPHELPPEVRMSPALSVEVDAMPGGYVCSATLKHGPKEGSVKAAAVTKQPLRKLFSKEQRDFYAAHAPEGVTIDDLTVLGPIFVLKLKSPPGEFGRRLVSEMWLYPDGSRVLELSTKCSPGEAFQAAAESRAFLAEHGIAVSGEQQTKTRKALDFFSGELAQR